MNEVTEKTSGTDTAHKVICAFYASTTYGSEYRAGLEFIQFAAAHGFDMAVIADLDENASPEILEAAAPGIKVIRIPSLVTRQTTLYRFTDVLPQALWHLRVARWLCAQNLTISALWVQNGALPWLPLIPYLKLARTVVWGPVGGGEPPPTAMMRKLPWRVRMRETLRSLLERRLLGRKFNAFRKLGAPRVVCIARTVEAQHQLSAGLVGPCIPVIPEILDPLPAVRLTKGTGTSPRLIWVGQDIPRKNLALALQLLAELRRSSFPQATLDVYGCNASDRHPQHGVRFHGWVSRIDWQSFRDDGVLLLTSFREGLPSVVLEAASQGLLCVAADVGAISSLNVDTVYTLPRGEYPAYSAATFEALARRITRHLAETRINLPPVSHRDRLLNHLRNQEIIE